MTVAMLLSTVNISDAKLVSATTKDQQYVPKDWEKFLAPMWLNAHVKSMKPTIEYSELDESDLDVETDAPDWVETRVTLPGKLNLTLDSQIIIVVELQ